MEAALVYFIIIAIIIFLIRLEIKSDGKKNNQNRPKPETTEISDELKEIIKKHPNEFKAWTDENDNILIEMLQNNSDINTISDELRKKEKTVYQRINYLTKIGKINVPETKYDFEFYHFTDPRNLPSIKKYGLLSWELLIKKGISHIPSSNSLSRELDKKRNLSNYVRLTLRQYHPMYDVALNDKRVKSLIWLKINPKVIELQGVLFSSDNATSKRSIINTEQATAINSTSTQAEVLIENKIDPKYITFPNRVN